MDAQQSLDLTQRRTALNDMMSRFRGDHEPLLMAWGEAFLAAKDELPEYDLLVASYDRLFQNTFGPTLFMMSRFIL